MFDREAYLEERRRIVNAELEARLPPAGTAPAVLHEAMRYAVLSDGKRIRPILCMAAAEAAGTRPEQALAPALALEALHAYTLVHDDLPCMDDDDFRRGRPTVHKVYGEAVALLVGDALLTLAFEWLAGTSAPLPYPPGRLALELAQAAGSLGVIGGQMEDIGATGREADAALLDYIHSHKTGALIRAAVRMGAIAATASETDLAAITAYGADLGTAFQVTDDILNATSSSASTGKPTGTDEARGKMTYVSVHGLDAARAKAEELVGRAIESLRGLKGPVEPLAALARYVLQRTR